MMLAEAWASRTGVAWLEPYWDSAAAPFRDVILTALARVAPFDSLVELGCHCGPNLARISARWPAAQYTGIDVNAEALNFGRQQLPHVRFVESSQFGLDLAGVLDAEVVLSCYALACADPAMVRAVFRALAQQQPHLKAIVLAEPLGHGELVTDPRRLPEYHHDYEVIAAEFWPGCQTFTDAITPHHGRLQSVLTIRP